MAKSFCLNDRVILQSIDHPRSLMRKPLETTIGKYKRGYFQRGTIEALLIRNTEEKSPIRESMISKVLNIITN